MNKELFPYKWEYWCIVEELDCILTTIDEGALSDEDNKCDFFIVRELIRFYDAIWATNFFSNSNCMDKEFAIEVAPNQFELVDGFEEHSSKEGDYLIILEFYQKYRYLIQD